MDNISNLRHEQIISPWVTLVTHTITMPAHPQPRDFHSLKLADYVGVLAVTEDGRIPLVRQYRPALDRYTLELPSGLRETGESPLDTARRELVEETGFNITGELLPLGCMAPDTGRLENKLWGFYATSVAQIADFIPEAEVELVLLDRAQFKDSILRGEFDHALHLALVAHALVRGHFSFQPVSASAS